MPREQLQPQTPPSHALSHIYLDSRGSIRPISYNLAAISGDLAPAPAPALWWGCRSAQCTSGRPRTYRRKKTRGKKKYAPRRPSGPPRTAPAAAPPSASEAGLRHECANVRGGKAVLCRVRAPREHSGAPWNTAESVLSSATRKTLRHKNTYSASSGAPAVCLC